MTRYLLCAVATLVCGLAQAEEFDARVIYVMDGDTVMVLHEGRKIRIRLANIDAPESDQAYGKESRQALLDRVLKKQVHVSSQAIDSYGRMIAELSVDGRSVNEEQVQNGMAWEYSHFHRNKRYVSLSSQAQRARRGIWAQPVQAVSPEQWRKTHPAKFPAAKAASSLYVNTVCGRKHLCSQMASCDEAKLYFVHCGVKSLDGDGDGVPCESLCVTAPVKMH